MLAGWIFAQHLAIESAVANVPHAEFEQTRLQDAFIITLSRVGVTQVRVDTYKIHEGVSRAGDLGISIRR